jgi:uncharacterized protein (TIGR03067 family)
MNTILLGLALVVAAPNLKDGPKKTPEIVGQWVLQKMSVGGEDRGTTGTKLVYEFTAEGLWITWRDGVANKKPPGVKYDAKAEPATIDVIETKPAGRTGTAMNKLGIYKVEGDTLTICVGRPSGERPTKFESGDGLPFMLITLTRAKKKD